MAAGSWESWKRWAAVASSPGRAPKRKRASNDGCPAKYTTRNGLNFTTRCHTNINNGDLNKVWAQDLKDCMDQCANYVGPCHAVAFNFEDNACWMKNADFDPDDPPSGAQSVTHLAIANADQMQPLPSACGWRNRSDQQSSNNETFQIYCGADVAGNDLCGPLGNDNNCQWKSHTETFQECVDLCSEHHPYCAAASWDHELHNGYGNCYLKSAVGGNPNPVAWTHFAVARPVNQTDPCADSPNSTYVSTSNGDVSFDLTCDTIRRGDNILVRHEDNFGACLDQCADYTETNSSCTAAVYDTYMLNGFENCYLKSGNRSEWGAPMGLSGSTFAAINQTTVQEPSGDSGSSAWIAGAVVGPVVFIAIIAFLIFFIVRRRKRQAAAQAPVEAGSTEIQQTPGEYGQATVYKKYDPSTADVAEVEGFPLAQGLANGAPQVYDKKVRSTAPVEADTHEVHEMSGDARAELPG
ncbi:hypothetical protein K402DRAFT_416983 [Aulographum hederae CBS 113979]|uniref:Apple domain-containing protein n=1 Tax=Aulographum hederae CBS 113979 TaxID=1176131 RepID=A0A6G1HFB2_9PEZI|nr:hypothetical protein K402DRAFT_416983 [Aulographum hederae CBS 113979]